MKEGLVFIFFSYYFGCCTQVTGKGFEDVADIGRDVATLSFMGIENIHAVRDSLSAFSAASMAQGQEYYHAVGASGWLRHLSQVNFFVVVFLSSSVRCPLYLGGYRLLTT